MNVRTWFLSAATAVFLTGSLFGVGCKSSSSAANNGATQTAQMMKTEEMMHVTPTQENMMPETPTAEQMMHETPTAEQMMHETPTPNR
jgi:hypothetical protein